MEQLQYNVLLLLFRVNLFIFSSWIIIALQCCVSFCCIMKWVSYIYTSITSLLDLSLSPCPIPSIYVITEHWAELLVLYSRFPLSVLHAAVHICQILCINTCELWSWRRLLRVPWTAGRSNQSILKEINHEYSLLIWLMLKLKFQYLGPWWEELTYWKRPWCWERLRAGGEGDDRGRDG